MCLDRSRFRARGSHLGYDQYSWQTEEFKHSGQRFVNWEVVEEAREVEIAPDGAGSTCSDSELISGHDAYGRGGCCSGHVGQSRLGGCNVCGCKATLVLLADLCRRILRQGPYAAYRPRDGYRGDDMCWKTGVDLIGRIV